MSGVIIRDGIWEFVGGKVEKKETKEQAIVREVYEELSLKTCIIRHLCAFYDEREDLRICVDAFLMKIVTGDLKLHAHYEARWIGVEELDNYQFEEADQPLLGIVKAL